jgi:hypothetical protein
MRETSTRNLMAFWAFCPACTKIYFLVFLLSFQKLHKKVKYWLVLTVANICIVIVDWKMGETSTRNLTTFREFCPFIQRFISSSFISMFRKKELVLTVAKICKVIVDWKKGKASTRNLMPFWAFCLACTQIYFFVIL